ncbi:germ cell nuclear acidic protein [Salarias fasciatus]|uniref:germ cell nuclear acidic protein n=1 Tax=Salarias fasciatus TaxID=181472 RepID=UPI00117657F7|nr:acidic repeat-containing protein-like [Salarias fasciatus]
MNDASSLLERVKKMSWKGDGGRDEAERKLMRSADNSKGTGRTGHLLTSESSDDDFDQFLLEKATPRAKAASQKSCRTAKKDSPATVVSSDDEDNFETFLQRMKTPVTQPKKISSGSEDSLKNFIVDDNSSDDDFIAPKSSFKVPMKTPTAEPPLRRPLFQFNSPVFISDDEDDDDDNIVIRSTWRTRTSKPKKNSSVGDKENESPTAPLLPVQSAFFQFPSKTETVTASPKRTLSAPTALCDSDSSEEEFTSLLDRLKKKNVIASSQCTPVQTKGSGKHPDVSGSSVKAGTKSSKPSVETPQPLKKPGKSSLLRPVVSQTEPRQPATSRVGLCKNTGSFLESLSNPSSVYVVSFKRNKEELTGKLYKLYNTTVFDSKLPVDMSVTWNKKMRKTAGYCVTGQERGGGKRYARIELSEKVCDSADRLRDTLIHEMCHAATWLINNVRDGHGSFWKLYARKATLVHPELPMVTRCHSYDINYKYQYQCTRCQNKIGRHSKSLDTQRFVCALCKGQLVLLTPSNPRGATPFAKFVKENYGNVRQELAGQSHAEVMRKLSADFASKTKLSES